MKKPCEMIFSLENAGVNKAEIARRMHVSPGAVTRYSNMDN